MCLKSYAAADGCSFGSCESVTRGMGHCLLLQDDRQGKKGWEKKEREDRSLPGGRSGEELVKGGGGGCYALERQSRESQILTLENHRYDNNYLTLYLSLSHPPSTLVPVLRFLFLSSCFSLFFFSSYVSFTPVILATSDKSNLAPFLLFDTH